jgi:glutamyl-tRNA reductase
LSVVVVSLEHDRAPLELIERLTVPEDQLGKALGTLRDKPNLAEVVVLSTCLRTEVYAVVDRFHEAVADVQEFLAAHSGVAAETLADRATVLFDDAVAVHLFEVASGLRSAVLGETEVLGQVRRARERAESERAAGPVLSGLFRHAVQTGRLVRSSTAIARGTTSLSHIAVDVTAQRLGGSLVGRRVVVVGAGEMGEGVVMALASDRHALGADPQPSSSPVGAEVPSPADPHTPAPLETDVVVANRTPVRAKALAERVGGRGVDLTALVDELAGADAVIVSTRATEPVLRAESVTAALSSRGTTRPLVVVDMGVPRNVDPAVGAIEGITLLDMSDLRAHADLALQGRRAERDRAEEIVDHEVERFRADQRARGAVPIVTALRGRLEELRLGELDRHRSKLERFDEEQRREVDALTRDVLAKLLHHPVVVLKETAGSPRGERLAEALRALFDL